MNKFCSQINNALNKNFIFLDLCFNKKYVYVLYKLLDLNLIKSFSFDDIKIRIFLRYYKNNPVFSLNCGFFSSNKKFFKLKKIKKNYKTSNDFITLFFINDSDSFVSDIDYMFLKKIGGLEILKINLIN